MRKINEHPIFVMIMAFIAGIIGVSFSFGESAWGQIPIRILLGIIMLWTMTLIADREIIIPNKKGIVFAFGKMSYFLAIIVISFFAVLISSVSQITIDGQWLMTAFSYLLFAISVGIFEEGLFRGIITNVLVKVMPHTRKGVYLAAMLSAFIFGCAHVLPYMRYLLIDFTPIMLQMIRKIIAGAGIGFLFSAVYIKTKNIWACIAVHALYDFISYVICLLEDQSYSEVMNYVDVTVNADFSYLILQIIATFVLYLPNVIIAWKILKTVDTNEK